MESIERPKRRPLIPRWVIAAAVACVLLAATGTGAVIVLRLSDEVTVPDVIGMAEGQANIELSRVGLDGVVSDRRFSSEPRGNVLEQSPAAGTDVSTGDEISLTLSAGTEEFVMPDIIGNGIVSATSILESRGLVLKIDVVESDSPVDIVLESYPSPGTFVRTGETVRLTISGEGTASSALLPYQLEGIVFVIDPAPVFDGDVDTTLEVARRLQSLIEASGGTSIVTRSSSESQTTPGIRQSRATVTSATVAIGFDVVADGPGGVIVFSQKSSSGAEVDVLSDELTVELAQALTEIDPDSVVGPVSNDPVLNAIARPAARVRLGSLSDDADVASFRDPTWADTIARSLYRALGERFGVL